MLKNAVAIGVASVLLLGFLFVDRGQEGSKAPSITPGYIIIIKGDYGSCPKGWRYLGDVGSFGLGGKTRLSEDAYVDTRFYGFCQKLE